MVDINWAKIKRTARQFSGDANMLALTPCSTTDLTLLNSCIPEWPQWKHDEPNNGDWFTTPQGPLIFTEGLLKEITPWIELLAHNLTQANITGTLTGATVVTRVPWAKHAQNTFSFPHLVLGYQSTPIKRSFSCDWTTIDPTIPAQLITPGLTWLTQHNANLLQGVDQATFWIDPTTAHTILTEQIHTKASTFTSSYHRPRKEIRYLNLSRPCTIELGVQRTDNDWKQRIDSLLDAIHHFPLNHLSVGFITDRALSWIRYHNQTWRDHPELWNEYIPYPLGIMILTQHHLNKANNLTNWTTTKLTPTHYLLQPKDPQPWFDFPTYHEGPTPELLANTRHDLGTMILDQTQATTLNLPWTNRD